MLDENHFSLDIGWWNMLHDSIIFLYTSNRKSRSVVLPYIRHWWPFLLLHWRAYFMRLFCIDASVKAPKPPFFMIASSSVPSWLRISARRWLAMSRCLVELMSRCLSTFHVGAKDVVFEREDGRLEPGRSWCAAFSCLRSYTCVTE